MRKLSVLLIIIAFAYALTGCTVMPASEETGVGPEEYAEIKKIEAIKNENENLKIELENIKNEITRMEKDYLELAKNNESALTKLEEAEAKLGILENYEVPTFISEKTDKNSIITYLNNNKNILEKRLKGIEIIETLDESKVLFYTVGYGDSFNQLFMWKAGESEPILINGADFEKNGRVDWLDNNFLQINVGSGEFKIIDTEKQQIISRFFTKQDAYLIPETSSYIIQKPDNGEFAVFDFINSTEKEIDINYKNKFTSFKVNDNNIIFLGTYTDEDETMYNVEAVINIEKLKENYNIISLEKAIDSISESTEQTEVIESTDEGTI